MRDEILAQVATRASLSGANVRDAYYDVETVWPEGFDPVAAGAELMHE